MWKQRRPWLVEGALSLAHKHSVALSVGRIELWLKQPSMKRSGWDASGTRCILNAARCQQSNDRRFPFAPELFL